jgi:glucosamine-6-phosphate deaminase
MSRPAVFTAFADPVKTKVVTLDDICRQQQVNDGCFPTFDAVPRNAITLTCPALMAGRTLVCAVPGPRKAAVVAATLEGPISTACPAGILRTHPAATIFMDAQAGARLNYRPASQAD